MVTEKLSEYIVSKGISMYAFENSLGVSRGSISKAIKENKSIGSQVVENILITYSDINPDWLLTGRGSMLRGGQESQIVSQPVIQQDLSGEEAIYYKMYKEEKEEKEKLLKENGRLEERLHQLEFRENTPEHPSISSQIAEAFTSEPSGGSAKDSTHTKKPTISGTSSVAKT